MEDSKYLMILDEVLNQDIVCADDLYKYKEDILLLNLISSNVEDIEGRHEQLIYKFWEDSRSESKSIPCIDDIICFVTQYNWETFYKIAQLEFYNDKYIYDRYVEENGKDGFTEEALKEQFAEMADAIWESSYHDYFGDIEEYIMEILDEDNRCFEYRSESEMYCYFSGPQYDLSIYRNDCQNLLFPKFHLEILDIVSREYSENSLFRTRIYNNK